MTRTTNEYITNAFIALGFEAGPFREDEHCTTRIGVKESLRYHSGHGFLVQRHFRVTVADMRQGLGQSVEIHEAGPLRVEVSSYEYNRRAVAENVAAKDVKQTIARLYEALD